MPKKILKPIIYKDSWHRDLAKKLADIVRETIFEPLLDAMDEAHTNAKETALESALRSGHIQFSGTRFTGKLSAAMSKELKELGARWYAGHYYLLTIQMPDHLLKAVNANQATTESLLKAFQIKLDGMYQRVVDKITSLTLESDAEQVLGKVSNEFKKTVHRELAVMPEISEEGKRNIHLKYLTTDELPIRLKLGKAFEKSTKESLINFSQETVEKMRADLKGMILGGRPRPEIRSFIQSRLHISNDRCKFIARQETALLTTMFKQENYQRYGINQYQWITVGDHHVRPRHKELGKIKGPFDYDMPPLISEPGQKPQYGNPGQGFNCRCIDKPIVEW